MRQPKRYDYERYHQYPLGTQRCCDIELTSLTLIQRHNNVVCPVGSDIIKTAEAATEQSDTAPSELAAVAMMTTTTKQWQHQL